MINLIIADDHQIFIDGLCSLLKDEPEIGIIREALNGQEVLTLIEAEAPDIVLLDYKMPVMDGLATMKAITEQFPQVKVLILSMHNDADIITGIIEAGAKGYLLKDTGKKELLTAIKTVMEGGNYYGDEVTATVMKGLQKAKVNSPATPELTTREKDVLRLLAQEHTTKEIAAQLFISKNTVETYRKNLLEKLGAKNAVGLGIWAVKLGLVD